MSRPALPRTRTRSARHPTAPVEGCDEVSAWIAHGRKKNDEALKLMRQAADADDSLGKSPISPGALVPARELLGDLLFELGETGKALVEYEAVLKVSPNRLNSLSGRLRGAAQWQEGPRRALLSARRRAH